MESKIPGVGGWRRVAWAGLLALPVAAQDDVQWIARFNAPGDSWDVTGCVFVDDLGFVYVGGGSTSAEDPSTVGVTETDLLTMKYSPSGQLIWARKYGDPGYGDEFVSDLVVDETGSVFVTGAAGLLAKDSREIVTIKYGRDGEQLWVALFDDVVKGTGEGVEIVSDGQGGVVVGGYCTDSSIHGGKPDIVLLRYDSAGNTVWRARYDGGYGQDDRATALAAGPDGSYALTGRVAYAQLTNGAISMRRDLVTLVYEHDGQLRWARRYDGGHHAQDEGYDIAVGASGNVYLTGVTKDPYAPDVYEDSVTLAYSPSGDLLWCARYEGPTGGVDTTRLLVLDDEENVYVAGQTNYLPNNWQAFAYLVIAYSKGGERLWSRVLPGPNSSAGWFSVARDMAVGPDGRVYVTGSISGSTSGWWTAGFEPSSGAIAWDHEFVFPSLLGPKMAFAPTGSLALTGGFMTPDWTIMTADTVTLQIRPALQSSSR